VGRGRPYMDPQRSGVVGNSGCEEHGGCCLCSLLWGISPIANGYHSLPAEWFAARQNWELWPEIQKIALFSQPPPSYRMTYCWMGSESTETSRQSAGFPQFSTSRIDLRALWALPILLCTWETSVSFDICCPWIYKLGDMEWETSIPAHRMQSSLGPAVARGIQRKEASKWI
jgi:hypothetical protein